MATIKEVQISCTPNRFVERPHTDLRIKVVKCGGDQLEFTEIVEDNDFKSRFEQIWSRIGHVLYREAVGKK